jgi:hypothetical protein
MASLSVSGGPFNEHEFRSKIPKDISPEDRCYYEKLIPVLKSRKPSDKPRIVIITDIEQDYDDLMAIIFLSEMHRLGVVELAGFIANHQQALRRARFLRTIVYLLGLGHLEVALGTAGVEKTDGPQYARLTASAYYELKNETFDQMIWNTKPHRPGQKPDRSPEQILHDLKTQVDPPDASPFRSGRELMDDLAMQVDTEGKEPLTVLLISSMQDIAEYFDAHKNEDAFFKQHFKKFVSQGGYYHVTAPDGTCTLEPNMDMNNNFVHKTAAKVYTDSLVKYNLPSDAWSREAAKAARLEGKTLGMLVDHGPIGTHLSWLYRRQEFKFYWDPYHAPYMPHLDPGWYATTRLCLDPLSKEYAKFTKTVPEFQDVVPYSKVIAYDGCAAMGAVGDDVMLALGVLLPADAVPAYNKAPHRHRIFGRGLDARGKPDPSDLGGIDGARLADAFQVFFYGALRATKDYAGRLIDPKAVRHRPVDRETLTPLHVFDMQTWYIREVKAMKAELKEKAAEAKVAREGPEKKRLEEEVQALEARIKECESAELKAVVNGVEKTFPRVPDPKQYPYPLLYERAVKHHEPPAWNAGG